MGKFIAKYRKIIIGILIVLIYLTILTLVSFLRSTEIKAIGENLVNYQDFHAAGPEEGTAWTDDTGLHIRDAGTGAKVFSSVISLRDFQMLQVEFEVECPESFAGEALLHVDLFAEGYDTDEQEFTVSLHAGRNKISGIIDKGEKAPDEVQLRIFCLDAVECNINNVNIQVMKEAPYGGQIEYAIILFILIVLLTLIISAAFFTAIPKQQQQNKLIKKANCEKRLDRICAIVLFCSIAIIMYILLGFAKNGIDAPFAYYGGDEISWYATIKGLLENGWYWHNDYLGAPFGASYFDWQGNFLINLDFFLAKILAIFCDNYVIIVNVQFIFAFALCGLSAFCVLRILGLDRRVSLAGGVLFAFSPYIFSRGTWHPMLTSSYLIPVSVLLCVWVTEAGPTYLRFDKNFGKDQKNIATIILSFLIANNGIGYYPFFACFLLCVAALYNAKYTKRISSFLKPFIVVGIIFIFLMLNILPSLIYQTVYGSNNITNRGMAEAEIYGLKITQLFMPVQAHGIEPLQGIIQEYNHNAPLTNENVGAYLGIGGIVGFTILFLCHFAVNLTKKELIYKRLTLFSNLVIASILLGTIGGFSSLLSVIGFRYLRAYNRISIYIEFISICALCYFFQILFNYNFAKYDSLIKKLEYFISFIFFILCLFDLLPVYGTYDATLEANKSNYESDSSFVAKIEEQLQEGDMVFQLPYHQYPEAGPVNNMNDYHLFTGYLHSKYLKWSYGGMKGRQSDNWNKYVSSLPMMELIDTVVAAGFRGLYIDVRGYLEEELVQIRAEIESITCEEPLYSDNGTLLFYNLYPYIEEHADLVSHQWLDIPPEDVWHLSYRDLGFSGDYELAQNAYGVVLHPSATQFGPYMTLGQGEYAITITGKNLNSCAYDVVTAYGMETIMTSEITHTNNEIKYTLFLPIETESIEFRLFNQSTENAQFEHLKIEKIQ